MKTRLDEGGTERCELSTPSPRARYGIKLAREREETTELLILLYSRKKHAGLSSLTLGKARVPTSCCAGTVQMSATCNVGYRLGVQPNMYRS